MLAMHDPDASIYPKMGLFSPSYSPTTGRTTLILGSSFMGKSTLIVKELNKLSPDDYFIILFFTESKNAEPLKNIRGDLPVKIIEGWDARYVHFIKELNDMFGNSYRALVILDDIIDQYHAKTLSKLILIFRNANISTVVSIQYPLLVSKSSRSSFHQAVILGSRSIEFWNETCKVLDLRGWFKSLVGNSLGVKMNNTDICENLKKITQDKNTAIYINLREGLTPSIVDV